MRAFRLASCSVLATSVLLFAGTAPAQFDEATLECRKEITTGAVKVSRAILKTFATCHRQRNNGQDTFLLDCNDLRRPIDAPDDYRTNVQNTCPDGPGDPWLYEECPAPCDEFDLSVGDANVGACLNCLNRHQIEIFAEESFGDPTAPADVGVARCHRSITKESSRAIAAILKKVVACQLRAEQSGITSTTECAETRYPELGAEALAKLTERIAAKACADLAYPIPALDGCGSPDSVAELASCIAGSANAAAAVLAQQFLSLPGPEPTTTTTNTTTTLEPTTTTIPVGDPDCPASASLVSHSRDTDVPCITNADCTPGTCEDSECARPTQVDLGWTGYGHDGDANDGDLVRLKLYCPGPAPVCGECDIVGVDPEPGNCRCQNDPRIVCDNPMVAHASECGGSACHCYTSTPTPTSSGGTPLCSVERFAESPSGTIHVDTGEVSIVGDRRVVVHLGIETRDPCPTCVGDTTANDGSLDGTCEGGRSDGLSCDAMSGNESFPAPGGSAGPAYSLDCMPNNNISGQGLLVDLEVGTGATSLASGLSCGGFAPELDCPCLLCTTDPAVACDSDSDCAGQDGRCSLSTGSSPALCDIDSDCLGRDAGLCSPSIDKCTGAFSIDCSVNADCDSVDLGTCTPSTCSSKGMGENPMPNSCDDLACTDLGNGEGECTTGPDLKYCDGVLKDNGDGVHTCGADLDCSVDVIGIDAGNCTLEARQKCFLDPITATGTASPGHPVTVAATCMPPSSGAGKNAVMGLPGPVRIVEQTSLTSWCGGDAYSPGAGCP